MNIEAIKNTIQKDINEIYQDIVNIRREIHMHPELGREEYKTQELIINTLTSLGLSPKKIADTGVIATINDDINTDKTIALRADIDALPTTELNEVSYKSRVVGKMHACGHDVHTAILLGVAKILNNNKHNIGGKIVLLFQPDEEDLGGAQRMIEEGALTGVDAIFGLHVNNHYQCGEIAIRYQQMNASSDMYKVVINGQAAHGAYPDEGVDTIVAAAQIIIATQSIVSRNVSPLDSAVITFGKIQGGETRNSLAGQVTIDGIVRTLNPNTRELVNNRLKTLIENTAKAMNVSVIIEHTPSYPVLMNDDELVDIVKQSAIDLLGIDNVHNKPSPSLGAEDFSYYSEQIPSAFYNLGTGNREKGIIAEAHSQYFDIDEDAIKIGIAMQINNVLNYLNKK